MDPLDEEAKAAVADAGDEPTAEAVDDAELVPEDWKESDETADVTTAAADEAAETAAEVTEDGDQAMEMAEAEARRQIIDHFSEVELRPGHSILDAMNQDPYLYSKMIGELAATASK